MAKNEVPYSKKDRASQFFFLFGRFPPQLVLGRPDRVPCLISWGWLVLDHTGNTSFPCPVAGAQICETAPKEKQSQCVEPSCEGWAAGKTIIT